MEIHMSMPKYFSIILVGLAATVCQAEIAIEVPPPEEQLEHPAASSGATPSEIELKVKPLRLAIDLVDGSHIIGVPNITSVPVQTAYAKMDIPFEKIVSIEIKDDHETASFELQNGDKLKGVLNFAPLGLETLFGKVSVDVQHVTSIRVHCGVIGMQGVVLHYSFDRDDGGIVPDKSGNGNSGRMHDAKWVENGKVGGGCSFTGGNDAIIAKASRSLDVGGSFTLCAFFNTTSTSSQQPIIEWHSGTHIGTHMWINVRSWGTGANIVGPQGTGPIGTRPSYAANTWHHLAVSYDEKTGDARTYFDGVPEANKNVGALSPRTAVDLYIGHRPQGRKTSFSGTLDEVMIFNRPLSEQEIKKLYDSQR
jgi:hypothetical protein